MIIKLKNISRRASFKNEKVIPKLISESPDYDFEIIRYFSLANFLDLIVNQKIFMCQLSRMKDKVLHKIGFGISAKSYVESILA